MRALSDDFQVVRYDPAMVIAFARACGDERLGELIGRRLIDGAVGQSQHCGLGRVPSGLALRTLDAIAGILLLNRGGG